MKKLSILISLLITINVYSQRINGGLGLTGPTGATGPTGTSASANNGCTLYGDSVGLGGSLSQETTIDANGNILYIGDVVTNTGLYIEPPYAGIFAESAAFIEAVKIFQSLGGKLDLNFKNNVERLKISEKLQNRLKDYVEYYTKKYGTGEEYLKGRGLSDLGTTFLLKKGSIYPHYVFVQ